MAVEKITVGDVEIIAVSDGQLYADPCTFFPSVEASKWDPYAADMTDEHNIALNIGSFLVRSDGQTVIFDTGMGDSKSTRVRGESGLLLENLRSKGISPEDITMVIMTHAHVDHVGTNLKRDGDKVEPVFPRARYWVSSVDWEACHNEEIQRDRFPNAPAQVWPLEELGVLELFDGEHAFTSHLTSLPTPGHTPGHMSITVSSQGEKALITGDIAHSVAQVHETDWFPAADIIPDLAVETRKRIFEQLEREGTVAASGHFPAPGFGKVVRLEGRRYWQGL
jgi:glyoxylase-like metal-dependent hydrolase (beta-lactamase superfamily II)